MLYRILSVAVCLRFQLPFNENLIYHMGQCVGVYPLVLHEAFEGYLIAFEKPPCEAFGRTMGIDLIFIGRLCCGYHSAFGSHMNTSIIAVSLIDAMR